MGSETPGHGAADGWAGIGIRNGLAESRSTACLTAVDFGPCGCLRRGTASTLQQHVVAADHGSDRAAVQLRHADRCRAIRAGGPARIAAVGASATGAASSADTSRYSAGLFRCVLA